MNKQFVKDQHYLSKGIIKNFANASGLVDVYDKKKRTILTGRSPKAYAVIKNDGFYDGTNEMVLSNCAFIHINADQPLEDGYRRMEDDIIPMIREVANNCALFYEEVYLQKIILFVHSLSERTKAVREQLENINATTKKMIGNSWENMDSRKVSKIQHNLMQLDMRKTHREVKEIFERYDIFPVSNNSKEPFIISDDPAGHLRYGFYDVCVPLCPNYGVLFIAKDVPLDKNKFNVVDNVVYINGAGAIRYNILQCTLGDYVFGQENKLRYYKVLYESQNGNS